MARQQLAGVVRTPRVCRTQTRRAPSAARRMPAGGVRTPGVCHTNSAARGKPDASVCSVRCTQSTSGCYSDTWRVPHGERFAQPTGCRRALCGRPACAARVALSAERLVPAGAVLTPSECSTVTGSAERGQQSAGGLYADT